jgi:hypothetical protein
MEKRHASHERLTRVEEVQGSSDRAFGVVIAVVLAAIGLWPLARGGGITMWPLPLAAAFLAAALLRPAVLGPLNRLWVKLGFLLARIVNPVLMAIMFYLVVTPMGIAARLLRNDPLKLRYDRSAETYWIERQPPGPTPETMKNQF